MSNIGTADKVVARERMSGHPRQSSDHGRSSRREESNRRNAHPAPPAQITGETPGGGLLQKVISVLMPDQAEDTMLSSREQSKPGRQTRPGHDKEALGPPVPLKPGQETSKHAQDSTLRRDFHRMEAQIERLTADNQHLTQEGTAKIQHLTNELHQYHRYTKDLNDTLHQRDAIIQSLQGSLAQLQEKHQELEDILDTRQEQALQSLATSKGLAPKEDRVVRDELSKLGGNVRLWARKHSVSSYSDLEAVPERDKDVMMASLGGYCIHQKWASMATDIPIPRDKLPTVLLHALLAKDVFETMFRDPFFAFARIEGDHSVPEPREIRTLYNTMTKFSESEAHIWRSQTLRNLSTAADTNLKPFLQERIKAICSDRVGRFFASPARILLRQTENSQQIQELQSIYKEAAKLALSLWTQRPFMACYSLRDLPSFSIANPIMNAHRLHHLDEEDTGLDGKRVLLVVQPAIVAFGSENAEHYDRYKIWAPAVVLVDGYL